MAVRNGWSRRAVLTAAGTVGATGALSGCSWFADPPPAPPDPLAPLLAGARALVARYAEVLTTHPELADRLTPLRDAHEAHVRALSELIHGPSASATGAPAGGWLAGATPATSAPVEDVLAELRQAERDAEQQAAEACLSAPAERTALLGSIVAARATHAEVLS